MKREPAVIAYDVTSNRRRRRVRRKLAAWSLDCQYSVFECLLTRNEATALFLDLASLIDDDTDKLLLVWLDRQRPSRMVVGQATMQFQSPALYTH